MSGNRRVLLLIGAVSLLTIGVMTMWNAGSSDQPSSLPPAAPLPPDTPRSTRASAVYTVGSFTPFKAKKLTLPFTFERPDNWVAGEEEQRRAPRYQQIVILGPRNAKDTYSAGLTIRIFPTKALGGQYASLEELVQWRRTQYARAEQFQLRQDQARHVMGLTGREIEVEFQAALSKSMSIAVHSVVKSHMVMVAHGDQLFEFSYSADLQDYARYHEAFDHLLTSLRLIR